jgi:hypothetical protein
MQLEDFLILPMQRITRYPMLLSALQATLEDEDLEKVDLDQAAIKIKNITLLINERTRQVEAVERLVEIQNKIIGGEALGLVAPGRSFIFEGRLRFKKMLTSNLDNPWAFLFSDMLMLCSKDPSEDVYLVKKIIPLDASTSVSFADFEDADDAESIEISTTLLVTVGTKQVAPKTYKVKAFGKAEKDKWLKHFRSLEDARAAKQMETATESPSSASEVKATVKQKLNSLRHLQAADSRVAALGTWRESRSLSRPNLAGIVSPREPPKLEKTSSAKSLATSSLAAPSSEKLARRPASRELVSNTASSPERLRPHHTRERSSTYGGGPPPLSLLSDEEKRELEALDFVSQNRSEPSLNGEGHSKRKSTDRDAAAITAADGSKSDTSSSASTSSSESEVDKKLLTPDSGSPTASKRMSKAKLNLRAISAFAASVIRGKKKDDNKASRSAESPQIDVPQTARAVLVSSSAESPRQEPEPVVPPIAEAGRILLRGSARSRKNAVTEVPSLLETSAPNDDEGRVDPEHTIHSKEQSIQLAIFSQALLDVFGLLTKFDETSETVQLTPKAARNPAVKHALEIIKKSGSEETTAFVSSILSRLPAPRKSSQFVRAVSSVDLLNGSSQGNVGDDTLVSLPTDIPVRSESIGESPRDSPRHSRSTPGIVVSSPRINKTVESDASRLPL